MMRKSDKVCFDMTRRAKLRGADVRRVLSVFARIRRAHVQFFNDLMWGKVKDNHGFEGISHLIDVNGYATPVKLADGCSLWYVSTNSVDAINPRCLLEQP